MLEEAARREGRHKATWAEARELEASWRAELVPPAVAARMLAISVRTLNRWVAAGRIQRQKLGDTRQAPARFRRSDIEAFKDELRAFARDPVGCNHGRAAAAGSARRPRTTSVPHSVPPTDQKPLKNSGTDRTN